MKKILAHKSTEGSACDLRDIIEAKLGWPHKTILVSKTVDAISSEGCLIRYGNSFPLIHGYPDTEYNPAGFCKLSANKELFSEYANSHGILSPVFHHYHDANNIPEFPVIIRTTLHGCGGEGILVVNDLNEFNQKWEPGFVWTPYYDNDYECRLYVVGQDITHAYYKVPFANQENDKVKIRSEYHFSYVSPDGIFGKLKKIVHQIQEETGGKFFSVDAAWIAKRNEYILFEINTGSWINESIGSHLADYLIKELKLEGMKP